VNDKRSGKGTYTFACGDTYEGEWLDGMYHGYGKYSSKDSDEYEGQWVKDRMSGHGKFFYRELGDVYEGDWEGGFREGFGKYTCADGTIYTGQYEVRMPLLAPCWRLCTPPLCTRHPLLTPPHTRTSQPRRVAR
jgi:hypothetical protein